MTLLTQGSSPAILDGPKGSTITAYINGQLVVIYTVRHRELHLIPRRPTTKELQQRLAERLQWLPGCPEQRLLPAVISMHPGRLALG